MGSDSTIAISLFFLLKTIVILQLFYNSLQRGKIVTGQQNKHNVKILIYFPDCRENQRFSRNDKTCLLKVKTVITRAINDLRAENASVSDICLMRAGQDSSK